MTAATTETETDTPAAITFFHNPRCSTSRNALALLHARGVQPTVVEYLRHPPDRATLQRLVDASGAPVADFVRSKDALYGELGLDAPGVTDAQRLDPVAQHPQLLQRPIIATARGVRVGRPIERVLEVLP